MGGPNYRHSPQGNKKTNPFLENVKKLLAHKEQAEKEENPVREMEDGFLKTKPSEYPEYSEYETEQEEPVREEAVRKTITKQGITLSSSACLTALVTIFASVGFAFLFGLIIGKGMTPTIEKAEPEKLEPKVAEQKNVEVLPKEELQFMTALKQETERKTKEQILAEKKAEEKALAEKKKAEEAKRNQAQAAVDATKKYDYDIRVAAFRSEEQADKLRVKLESDGFRTKKDVKKDTKGNWYYIHVLLIGTEERLAESRERFKKFGISDSIVESKVEVK